MRDVTKRPQSSRRQSEVPATRRPGNAGRPCRRADRLQFFGGGLHDCSAAGGQRIRPRGRSPATRRSNARGVAHASVLEASQCGRRVAAAGADRRRARAEEPVGAKTPEVPRPAGRSARARLSVRPVLQHLGSTTRPSTRSRCISPSRRPTRTTRPTSCCWRFLRQEGRRRRGAGRVQRGPGRQSGQRGHLVPQGAGRGPHPRLRRGRGRLAHGPRPFAG